MPALTPDTLSAIMVLIAMEAVVLALVLRRLGLVRFIPAVMAFLVSGAFLMEALRGALGGAVVLPLPGLLLGSLVSHLACLALAWRALKSSR